MAAFLLYASLGITLIILGVMGGSSSLLFLGVSMAACSLVFSYLLGPVVPEVSDTEREQMREENVRKPWKDNGEAAILERESKSNLDQLVEKYLTTDMDALTFSIQAEESNV